MFTLKSLMNVNVKHFYARSDKLKDVQISTDLIGNNTFINVFQIAFL